MKCCRNFGDNLEDVEIFWNFEFSKEKFRKIPILKEFEWFEWFGPSPIEPFNSASYRRGASAPGPGTENKGRGPTHDLSLAWPILRSAPRHRHPGAAAVVLAELMRCPSHSRAESRQQLKISFAIRRVQWKQYSTTAKKTRRRACPMPSLPSFCANLHVDACRKKAPGTQPVPRQKTVNVGKPRKVAELWSRDCILKIILTKSLKNKETWKASTRKKHGLTHVNTFHENR